MSDNDTSVTYADSPARPGAPDTDGTVRITPTTLGAHTVYDPDGDSSFAELDELLCDMIDDYDSAAAYHPWITDIEIDDGSQDTERTGDVTVTFVSNANDVDTEETPDLTTRVYRYSDLCAALGCWADWVEVHLSNAPGTDPRRRAATMIVTEDWDALGALVDIEITDAVIQFLIWGRIVCS